MNLLINIDDDYASLFHAIVDFYDSVKKSSITKCQN